jgi:phenylacetate-CoA ligase
VSFIIKEKCLCGRMTKRLGPILGRKNQMLKYKGTTIFPESIISILEGDEKFHGGYVEALKNNDGTDRVILYASLADNNSDPVMETAWIKEKLRSKIRVAPEINIISKEDADNRIYQFDEKRKRQTFFDKR